MVDHATQCNDDDDEDEDDDQDERPCAWMDTPRSQLILALIRRGWTCRIVGRRRLRSTMGCAVVLPLRETHRGGGGGGGGGGGALYMISPDIGQSALMRADECSHVLTRA